MQRILSRCAEVETLTAAGGADGVAIALAEQPMLVFLDLHLQGLGGEGLGGEDVLRLLRADPRTAGLDVVITSGDAHRLTGERLLALGATSFLPKPFSVADLMSAVTAAATRG
jgi:CheY-like chemotaxis protein